VRFPRVLFTHGGSFLYESICYRYRTAQICLSQSESCNKQEKMSKND